MGEGVKMKLLLGQFVIIFIVWIGLLTFFSGYEQCKSAYLLLSYFMASITNRFNNKNMDSREEKVESTIIHLL